MSSTNFSHHLGVCTCRSSSFSFLCLLLTLLPTPKVVPATLLLRSLRNAKYCLIVRSQGPNCRLPSPFSYALGYVCLPCPHFRHRRVFIVRELVLNRPLCQHCILHFGFLLLLLILWPRHLVLPFLALQTLTLVWPQDVPTPRSWNLNPLNGYVFLTILIWAVFLKYTLPLAP